MTKHTLVSKISRLMRMHQVEKLPEALNPRKTANQDREIVGQVQICELKRLADLVESTESTFIMSLIVVYENNRLQMRGNINGELSMKCQRCLKPVSVNIDSNFTCVIVRDEEASKALPTNVDGYICEETILLHELAEDELLLAMPMSSKHDKCDDDFDFGHVAEEKNNPFANLKSLIKPN